MMKTIYATTILCLLLASLCGSAVSEANPPSTQVLQEISTLSSQQLYTQFALTRTMLEGKWNQKLFDQFSYFDGINLQMMKRYGEKFKDDKKWGPFFEMKSSLHLEVSRKLKPLIEKKRGGDKLAEADLKLLEDLDKQIFEKLIK